MQHYLTQTLSQCIVVSYLHVGLCVSCQERLPRGLQIWLPGRKKWPCVCCPRLVEVKDSYWTLRQNVWPHHPLSRKHGLLPLLIKGWSRLAEWEWVLAGNRMSAVEKWRRWGRRRAPLLK